MANPNLTGFSRNAISTRGVEDIHIYELGVTAPSSSASLGYVKSVEFKQEAGQTEIVDSRGDYVNTLINSMKVMVTAVVLQTKKEMFDVIANTNEKFYAVYIRSKLTDGKYQEIYIPLAKIKPTATLSYSNSERTISVEISALLGKHTSQTDVAIGVAADVVPIPVGAYYGMLETANTPKGTFKADTSDDLNDDFV